MCLAEALLRIPDSADRRSPDRDKIGNTEWEKRLGASHSTFVNAGTWALMLTGRIVNLDNDDRNLGGTLKRLVARAGEPVIRQAVITAMRILGNQFVMGRNIHEAIERARSAEEGNGYRHSYDMLGEAARRTAPTPSATSSRYAATRSVGAIGDGRRRPPGISRRRSISIKLSALHPRYEVANEAARASTSCCPAQGARGRARARNCRLHHRRRGSRPPRPDARSTSLEALAVDSELAGWNGSRVSPSRPTRSAPCRCSTGSPTSPTAATGG
jgi:RHH-type proline utilization regulon transcriptional repressor/proline dehydrogenase/delta 1-pyrroline-5-carboxylate dehydrogenase